MSDEPPPEDGKGILHPEGMTAARNLAAGLVHEVNNILGVIIGNAHLAKKNASDEASVEKYMAEVRYAAEEGRELMRSLAVLAGDQRSRSRRVLLNDLVEGASSNRSKSVELDLCSDDPGVELDLWLAQEALGGVLALMADTRTAGSVRAVTRVSGGAAVLTLEDDGPSPSGKELETLFSPFAKLERRPKAGLAFTKLADLASRSGGSVLASARQPKGLRIVLSLPLA